MVIFLKGAQSVLIAANLTLVGACALIVGVKRQHVTDLMRMAAQKMGETFLVWLKGGRWHGGANGTRRVGLSSKGGDTNFGDGAIYVSKGVAR